ncbi:MAG TPA: DUF418 domain-containing protein [Pseudonocardia sp.]|nr:DUF418 domain-containing protein [Pseudonocardia sp.]
MTADPGATPVAARALAPDLARGGMLLLIALANVHYYLYDRPAGTHGYPARLTGVADQVVTVLQMSLVDGRAYPLFGFLFGYGIVQLAWRRGAVGMPVAAVTRLVRRRGRWMIVIGLLHGVLLWPGDIVGAYGLLALLLAGVLIRGSERALLVISVIGMSIITLLYAGAALPLPDGSRAQLPSMAIADAGPALIARVGEWVGIGLVIQAIGVFAAVALGAGAARRRLLDEPERHLVLLRRIAVGGLLAAVLGGLPLALITAGLWSAPPLPVRLLAGGLHAISGYAGGLGYAALFGLSAEWVAGRGGPGSVVRAVQASGQRSLSCYLAQSVAFVPLLPAWTLGLGASTRVWQAALLALGVWLVILVVATASDRAGYRGPAELLLRRLTYGQPREGAFR